MTRYAAGFLALVTATAALAHGSVTGVVRERMDGMVDQGRALKVLTLEAAKPLPDPDVFWAAAGQIAQHSGQTLLDRFPDGSLQPGSEALPLIWQDWEQFKTLAFALEANALALATASPEKAAALVQEATQTCNACHDRFRLKK